VHLIALGDEAYRVLLLALCQGVPIWDPRESAAEEEKMNKK
jgi:hypothetical protein